MAHDSSGISIVETMLPDRGGAAEWNASNEPQVVIGDGRNSAHELTRIAGAIRLSNGNIVVANGNPEELRMFDSTGLFVRRIGREGSGPGEFRRIVSLQRLAGDSILVFDSRLRRLSIFAGDGGLATSLVLASSPRGDSSEDAIPPRTVVGALPTGLYVATGERFPPRKEGINIPRTSVALLTPSLDSVIPVGEFAGNHLMLRRTGPESFGFWNPDFGRTTHVITSTDGFYVAHNESWVIQHYDLKGELRTILRVGGEAYRLTDQDYDRILDSLAADRPSLAPKYRSLWKHEISQYPTVPAYGATLVDDENNLWVRGSAHPGHDWPAWNVFNADGELLATAATPVGATVLGIGSDYVIAKVAGPDGEDRVVQFRLEK